VTVIETINEARKILKDKLDPSRSFPDNSSSFLEDGEMTNWYNWGQKEVQNLLIHSHENWFVTQTSVDIVNGTDEYAMPAGTIKIVRVEDRSDPDNTIEISPVPYNASNNYGLLIKQSGVSNLKCYSIRGNSIVLKPKPTYSKASGVGIHFVKIVDDLVSASSCSTIPDQYHELIMWTVVENGLIKQEANAEAMAAVLGRRNRLVDMLVKGSKQRQVQQSRTVRRRKWGF
jgi:hypothetical protein